MQNSCQRSKNTKKNCHYRQKKIKKKITHHHQPLHFQVLFPFPVETKNVTMSDTWLDFATQNFQWLNMSCYPSVSNLLYCFPPDYSKTAKEACYLWPNTAMLDKANTAKDMINQYPQISTSSSISFIQSSHGGPSDLSCNLSCKKSCFSVLHCWQNDRA